MIGGKLWSELSNRGLKIEWGLSDFQRHNKDKPADNWIYTVTKMEKPNRFICLISGIYGRVYKIINSCNLLAK